MGVVGIDDRETEIFVRPRGKEQMGCGRAVLDERLGSGQAVASDESDSLGVDSGRIILQPDAEHGITGRDLGEPLLLQFVVCASFDRRGGERLRDER